MSQRPSNTRALGLDVQIARGCTWVLLEEGEAVTGGWLTGPGSVQDAFAELVQGLLREGPLAVGIDAPRRPLAGPRTHAFRGGLGGSWGPMAGVGWGRHCEVVVKSLGLGNPQWTRPAGEEPAWMSLGFALFQGAEAAGADPVLEVFPSAAYRALEGASEVVRVPAGALAPGPKDVLDATMAAATVRRVLEGEGAELGGGDGLGTIALPRRLTREEAASAVHRWPE